MQKQVSQMLLQQLGQMQQIVEPAKQKRQNLQQKKELQFPELFFQI